MMRVRVSVLILLLAIGTTVTRARAQDYPVPTTGEKIERYVPLDDIVVEYMKLVDASSATIALSQNGELVHSRGFGWKDANRRRDTDPHTLYRIASVSKPITSSMVKAAIRTGKLKPDQKVVEVLTRKWSDLKFSDPRWNDITIEHLLEHQGGWDRGSSFDPMFREREIQRTLRVRGTLTPLHVVQYMSQQPLQFDPGSKRAYSNFGYCVLGRVLEVVYDRPYSESLAALVLQPIDSKEMQLGVSSARKRPAEETWYPVREDAYVIEVLDAPGGIIASTPALCKFMDNYWISGEPRQPGYRYNYTFFGSLPGTTAFVHQTPARWNLAILINNRRDAKFNEDHTWLLKEVDRVLESLK